MPTDGLHRPIIPVLIESPGGKRLVVDALIDTGSDITIFPDAFAEALDINLTSRPERPVNSALGVIATYRESEVLLELRRAPDEIFQWKTIVGFLPRRMAYSILGTKGFFEFFSLNYDARQQSLEIQPHDSLPT